MSPIALSLLVAAFSVALSLAPALIVAWVIERSSWRGRWALEALAALPLVLPPVVTGYLLLEIFSPKRPLGAMLETLGIPVAFHFLGAVVAAAVVGFPLLVLGAAVAFQSVDPKLEEQAQTLGESRWGSIRRVTLPLAAPGILAGVLLAFARALGEFGATIILAGRIPGITETIPLAIYGFLETPGGLAQARLLALTAVALGVAAIGAAKCASLRWRHRLGRAR